MKITNYDLKIKNKILLKDLNVEFYEGEINHILGPNGVGKSIFAKDFILNGKQKFNLEEKDLCVIGSYTNLPLDYKVKDLISFIKQDKSELFDYLYDSLSINKIDENLLYKSLSDGQKQKLKILGFFQSDVKVIILDELLNAVDKKSSNEIYTFLKTFINKHKDVVIINITHNLVDLSAMEGKYFLYDDQNIIKITTKEEIIKEYTGI